MDSHSFDLSLLDSDPNLKDKVVHSLSVIREAFSKWQFEEIGLAFNGGKDSVVLVALIQHILSSPDSQLSRSINGNPAPLKTVFFLLKNEYEEVVKFMWKTANSYDLHVIILRTGFMEGLEILTQGKYGENGQRSEPLKAMFMGTRRTDPGGTNLNSFSPTDPTWPQLMRINPILDWNYYDIWNFINLYNLPYCELYDIGYTSIGSTDDTTTNENLWNSAKKAYNPPWHLSSPLLERGGRGCKRFLLNLKIEHLLEYPPSILAKIVAKLDASSIKALWMIGNQKIRTLLETIEIEEFLLEHDGNLKSSLPMLKAFQHLIKLNIDLKHEQQHTIDLAQQLATNLPPSLEILKVKCKGAEHLLAEVCKAEHLKKLHTIFYHGDNPIFYTRILPSTLKHLYISGVTDTFEGGPLPEKLETFSLENSSKFGDSEVLLLPSMLKNLTLEKMCSITEVGIQNLPLTLKTVKIKMQANVNIEALKQRLPDLNQVPLVQILE